MISIIQYQPFKPIALTLVKASVTVWCFMCQLLPLCHHNPVKILHKTVDLSKEVHHWHNTPNLIYLYMHIQNVFQIMFWGLWHFFLCSSYKLKIISVSIYQFGVLLLGGLDPYTKDVQIDKKWRKSYWYLWQSVK